MKTILVVDDFASVRLYHTTVLHRLGHQVLTAVNGTEGLEKLRTHAIDLVLLDMLMPGMDGCEFLERARALPQYARLPVLVITSEGTRSHEERFQRAGASAFLVKPALPDAMERILKSWLA